MELTAAAVALNTVGEQIAAQQRRNANIFAQYATRSRYQLRHANAQRKQVIARAKLVIARVGGAACVPEITSLAGAINYGCMHT